jgi:DNA helicase-2/ATP-dependent DNA helicase PcrA
MDEQIWRENGKLKFRFQKVIKPNAESPETKLKYISVLDILDPQSAPKKVSDIILFLKNKKIISDLNQIAFFMRSIAYDNVRLFLEEFEKRRIPYYAPRAKKYLKNDEVKEIVACFIQILAYTGDEVKSKEAFQEITKYCDNAYDDLKDKCKNQKKYLSLAYYLDEISTTIHNLKGKETLEIGLVDIFYKILAYEPFSSYLEDEATARNLAIFSRLLMLFQQYYHMPIITAKNKIAIAGRFFNSYLRFIILNGLNEYEDPYDVFPSGKIQVMTIHQAKGLEFPVVFVAGLEKKNPPRDNADKLLGPYYHRKEFEPYERINDFDQMRLSYVAFSRPQNLLILVATRTPFKYYRKIFDKVVDYDSVNREQWLKIIVKTKDKKASKLEYGFTSHINVYDTCPRQYLMYKEYEFTPARAAQRIFGSLVHQTIEDIHRHVIEKLPEELTEEKVLEYFENNKRGYIKQGVHPFNEEAAREHVLNYFRNNQEIISKVKETEFEVVVEKSDYYLKGILDLISGDDGSINILDFKAQARPDPTSPVLENYRRQLAVYSHIVEKKRGIKPTRSIIYWTGEQVKKNAIMEIHTSMVEVEKVINHFDKVVSKIRNKEFKVVNKPDKKICSECDFRHCCKTEE